MQFWKPYWIGGRYCVKNINFGDYSETTLAWQRRHKILEDMMSNILLLYVQKVRWFKGASQFFFFVLFFCYPLAIFPVFVFPFYPNCFGGFVTCKSFVALWLFFLVWAG